MGMQLVAAVSVYYGVIWIVFGLYKIVQRWRRRGPRQQLIDRMDQRVADGWVIVTTPDRTAYFGSLVGPGKGRLIIRESEPPPPSSSVSYGHLRLVVDNEDKK